MTIFIDVDPSFEDSPDLPNFNDLIIAVFSDQKIPVESDVTIVIVDDDQIHKLNRVFLDEDKPTDILAFPAGHVDPDTGHQNYGDIIISYPRAKNQADLAGHPLSSELSLLTIHGLLHLIGFNHDQPESEAEMWQVQSAVLKKMGVNIKPPDHSTQLNNQS